MSICRSSISSAVAVDVGSGRGGVVAVGVGSGRGGVVAVGVGSGRGGKVGVDVDGEGGGSCVEQPETIKAADTKMTAITRFVDIAFSSRDSIPNPTVEWDCARKSYLAEAALSSLSCRERLFV